MKDKALYLEADEDITSAIDKLRKTTSESVQIVVPKRSTLLQSIINLKLLKKASEAAGKQLVLVTGDRVATELAGRVGLAVAPSVGARSAMAAPAAEKAPEPIEDVIDDTSPVAGPEAEAVALVAAGEAVAAGAAAAEAAAAEEAAAPAEGSAKPLFVHREVGKAASEAKAAKLAAETAEATGLAEAETAANPTAPPVSTAAFDGDEPAAVKKMPKVPTPARLYKILAVVTLVVLLVGGYFAGMYFYSTAKATLFVSASKTGVNADFTVATDGAAADPAKSILPGQTVKIEKDLTSPATPTGKKDVGTKATGTVTITNYCYNPGTLAAGTAFTYSGLRFVSNEAVTVPAAVPSGGACNAPTTASVAVTSAQNGDSYNIASGLALTLASPSGAYTSTSYMSAKSAAQFSGGTSKTVTVLTQSDVDKAKTDALAKDKDGTLKDLAAKVPADYLGIAVSQAQTAASVSSTPAVDEVADTATVTVHAVYTEAAVKRSDLKTWLDNLEQHQIGSGNQLYDDGLSTMGITSATGAAGDTTNFHLATDAYAGAKFDTAAIAKTIAGKRYGEAVDTLGRLPGVQKVELLLQPIWATQVPSRTSQIKLDIKVNGLTR